MVASIPATPTRLATKFGVSNARTTPLPSVLVTKASKVSSTSAPVLGVLINSTKAM